MAERTKELAELNKPGTFWQKNWVRQPLGQKLARLSGAMFLSGVIISTFILMALQGISFAATAAGTIPGVTVGAGMLDKILSPITEAGKLFFGQASIGAGFGAFALVAAVVIPLIVFGLMTWNTYKTSKINFETPSKAKDNHKRKDSVSKDFFQGFLKFCAFGLAAFALGAAGFALSQVQLFGMSAEVGAYVTPGLGIGAASFVLLFALKQLYDYAQAKYQQIPAGEPDSNRGSRYITDLQIQPPNKPLLPLQEAASGNLSESGRLGQENKQNSYKKIFGSRGAVRGT